MSLQVVLAGLLLAAVAPADVVRNVPDAASVGWQGKKPCENLFEDAQIRVLRCTFAPGAMHVMHSHPGHLTYVLKGGRRQIRDPKGAVEGEALTDAMSNSAPVPWHEMTNTGDTTIRYLIIERKYEPVAGAGGGQ